MNDNPALATTSVEAPVARNIWGRIWANKLAKELILVVASAAAVQFAVAGGDLIGIFDTAKSWSDLFVSVSAWGEGFSFALVVTVCKQALAWGIAKAAGTKL